MRSTTMKGAVLSLAALTAVTMTGCSKADGSAGASGGDGVEAAVGQKGAEVGGVGVDSPEAVLDGEIDGCGVVQ